MSHTKQFNPINWYTTYEKISHIRNHAVYHDLFG